MEECLAYFRRAVLDPLSVPPWSEWWAANAGLVERVFSPLEFVRLKHRRLSGARQLLQNAGELPEGYVRPSPLVAGSCGHCGERTTNHSAGPGGGYVTCPTCGVVSTYDCRHATVGGVQDAEPGAAPDGGDTTAFPHS